MKTSLVLATYNGEEYVVEQLDSIRLQNRKIDEVIICDDRSTDNTYQIITDYIKQYKLTNWFIEINENNLGYATNFTKMLKKVSGDIIFLADQDDIWEKDKIEIMAKIMEKNSNILLLASNLIPLYMSEDAPRLNYEKFCNKDKLIKIGFNGRWIKPIRPGCSFAIRRELLKEYANIWNKELPHDCILWNISSLMDKSYLLNIPTMKYRRHSANASNLGNKNVNYRIKCIDEELEIMNIVLEKISLDTYKRNFIEKQKDLYEKRKKVLKNRKILKCFSLLPLIKYYGRKRFWLTDLYYCIKGGK